MDMTAVTYLFLGFLGIYLIIGILFSTVILIKGLSSLDPNTKSSGVGFKIIIIPGLIAFWPILWRKWMK